MSCAMLPTILPGTCAGSEDLVILAVPMAGDLDGSHSQPEYVRTSSGSLRRMLIPTTEVSISTVQDQSNLGSTGISQSNQ
jgi:hypothetical protein